ncbi:hypothetical protein Pmar_PMAR003500, partial [Perkinsus marinus ATCC 50983]
HVGKNCRLAAKNKQLTCQRCGGLHHVPAVCRGRILSSPSQESQKEATPTTYESKPGGEGTSTTNAYSLLPATDVTWLAHSSASTAARVSPLTAGMMVHSRTSNSKPQQHRVLLDTGAARSFVAEAWMRDHPDYIHDTRGEKVEVMMADCRKFTPNTAVLLHFSAPG